MRNKIVAIQTKINFYLSCILLPKWKSFLTRRSLTSGLNSLNFVSLTHSSQGLVVKVADFGHYRRRFESCPPHPYSSETTEVYHMPYWLQIKSCRDRWRLVRVALKSTELPTAAASLQLKSCRDRWRLVRCSWDCKKSFLHEQHVSSFFIRGLFRFKHSTPTLPQVRHINSIFRCNSILTF